VFSMKAREDSLVLESFLPPAASCWSRVTLLNLRELVLARWLAGQDHNLALSAAALRAAARAPGTACLHARCHGEC